MSGNNNYYTGLEIAVIGMAGRFPGAKDLKEYWNNLIEGKETVSFFSKEELTEAGVEASVLENKNFIRAKGMIDEIDCFDSDFFNFTPNEAKMLDPQVRLAHECSWHALEDAGYNPYNYGGLIGLFAGHTANLLWSANNMVNMSKGTGQFVASTLNPNFFSTLLSYKLNLKGPSVTLNTACSTSLVAIHLACRSLLTGECDMALAGGVTITLPNKNGYLYQDGMVMSSDGHCKAFDENANGIVNGDGIGMVVLKRLTEAIEDNDNIYAIIRGSAINNDGGRKVGYTAPSIEGQSEVIRAVHEMAEISPESISYIEAHGTGTNFGDPVEIEALKKAFNTKKRNYCGVGSVKSNIGHIDSASGVASFIKVVLAIKNKKMPPTLHVQKPNPKIDFDNSPFYVNTTLKKWDTSGSPLRAGVSSFGIGGTNAHLVLESLHKKGSSANQREHQIILLSANSEGALDRMGHQFVEFLKKNNDIDLEDLSYTLHTGRKIFKYRRGMVASSVDEIIDHFLSDDSGKASSLTVSEDIKKVIFMFPGQGSQYVNMARGLYQTEKIFKHEIDICFGILDNLLDYHIKDILFPLKNTDNSDNELARIDRAPIVIFITEYALAKLLISWGIVPYAMIGHSIGEYVAASLSEVITLEDTLNIVVNRGKLMMKLPPGIMLSVPLPKNKLLEYLGEGISLAADHGESCLVSGSGDDIVRFEEMMKSKRFICQRLNISHAGHSEMLNSMAGDFKNMLGQVKFSKPQLPYVSTVTGNWITVGNATSPEYWIKHLCETVNFADGIKRLMENDNTLFIEVGPGNVLSTIAVQYRKKDLNQHIFNLLRHPQQDISDQEFLMKKLLRFKQVGGEVDWAKFYKEGERHKISLPLYPFDKTIYPVDNVSIKRLLNSNTNNFTEAGNGKRGMDKWFYLPSWKNSPMNKIATSKQGDGIWLLFANLIPNLNEFINKTTEFAEDVIIVEEGSRFEKIDKNRFTLNPSIEDNYTDLIAGLGEKADKISQVVNLWNLGEGKDFEYSGPNLERVKNLGFYNMLFMVKAMSASKLNQKIRYVAIMDNLHALPGALQVNAAKATIIGTVKVIPLEYPTISCKCIDIDSNNLTVNKELVSQLITECMINPNDQMVAYRRRQRYVQRFEPVDLTAPVGFTDAIVKNGTYLLAGGIGGIGLEIGDFLAKNYHAKLIYTDQVQIPPQGQWADIIPNQSVDEGLRKKIARLKQIEDYGVPLRVYQADITDEESMKKVVDAVINEFGKLNGVVHCAGVSEGGLLFTKTKEITERVFRPKIEGTVALHKAIEGVNPDFVLYCSSLNSIIPGMGLVDYCSANAFLDAFAYNEYMDKGRDVISLNWDAWQGAGGAVDAATRMAEKMLIKNEKSMDHPVFEKYTNDGRQVVFSGKLNSNKHWMLNEHRINNKATLPGTAFLQLVVSAFKEIKGTAKVKIKNMMFLLPLSVEDGVDKEVNVTLTGNAANYEFRIVSLDEQAVHEHATGVISLLENDFAKNVDINELNADAGWVQATMHENQEDHRTVSFGQRWTNNYTSLKLKEKERLSELALPGEFADDLKEYNLHPALLDCAMATFNSNGYYLPFSYKEIDISGDLPRRIISYAKFSEGVKSSSFLSYDMQICNEQGKCIVEIDRYVLLKVNSNMQSENSNVQTQAPSKAGDDVIKTMVGVHLKDGILPKEGVEVFNRVIGSGLPQVIVSTSDIFLKLEEVQKPKSRTGFSGGADGGFERKQVVMPMNELEEMISGLWKNYLGIDKIGVHDNFFDMGANSLAIIQVNNKLKMALEVDLPVVTMYIHPTIRELALHLSSNGSGDVLNIEEEDADRKNAGRNKLKQRKSKLKEI